MAVESFYWRIFDASGTAITGATPTAKVTRESDGYMLDFSSNTFKASGWSTLAGSMSEVDATNDAGAYVIDLTISSWTDGRYNIRTDYAGTPAQHGSRDFYIKSAAAW